MTTSGMTKEALASSLGELSDKIGGRKPTSVPEKHQLRILLDVMKNPQKARILGPYDDTEAERILREDFQYTDADIKRLKKS